MARPWTEETVIYVCCVLKTGRRAGTHVWRYSGTADDVEPRPAPAGAPHPWVEGRRAADYPPGAEMRVTTRKRIDILLNP